MLVSSCARTPSGTPAPRIIHAAHVEFSPMTSSSAPSARGVKTELP